jgi:hypothetical protein
LVLMRSRKPCVLRRRLRFGWNVRFMDMAPIERSVPDRRTWYGTRPLRECQRVAGSPAGAENPKHAMVRTTRRKLCSSRARVSISSLTV